MKTINNYKYLNIWKENDLQTIYMGINTKNEDEVVLINQIKKDGFIDKDIFNKLVTNLSNLCYYEENENYTLVSRYNEGAPLANYIQTHTIDKENAEIILEDFLKKVTDYDQLPVKINNILLDPLQIIIHKNEIFINEIIDLKRLNKANDFHQSLRRIAQFLLNPESKSQLAYFSSNQFKETNSFKQIYQQYKKINQEAIDLISDEKNTAEKSKEKEKFVPIFIDELPDGNSLVSEEVTNNEKAIEDKKNNETITKSNTDNQISDKNKSLEKEKPIETAAIILDTEDGEKIIELEKTEDKIIDKKTTTSTTSAKAKNKKSDIILWRRIAVGLIAILLLFLLVNGFKNLWTNDSTSQKQVTMLSEKKDKISFEVKQDEDNLHLINNSQVDANSEIISYIWKIVKDKQVIYSGQGNELEFTLNEDGEYYISLLALNSNGSFSEPYLQIVERKNSVIEIKTPDKKQAEENKNLLVEHLAKMPTDINNPQVVIEDQTANNNNGISPPESNIAGEIVKDPTVKKFADSSKRITKPQDQYYKIYQADQAINAGDVISFWLKTDNNQGVSIKLVGYQNGALKLEEASYYSPALVDDFNMYYYTFEKGGLDHLEVYIKSDSNYLWYENINLGQIK